MSSRGGGQSDLPAQASSGLPTYFWLPEGSRLDAAHEAADLARQLGDDVGEPEIAALSVLLAETPEGKRAAFQSGLYASRQNIKTWAGQRGPVLYRGWIQAVERIVWTAHLFKTTQLTFEDITALIDAHTWLARQVLKINYGNGDESIRLRNGCRIDFLARSARSARGYQGDEVIFDEDLFNTTSMMGALLPILSTRPDPHVTHLSSQGIQSSEVSREIRDRGRRGGDPNLAYGEWTSERKLTPEELELPADKRPNVRPACDRENCTHRAGVAVGCALDNESNWVPANPALDRRITRSYVRSERSAMAIDEFMRERMGWWEDPPADGVIERPVSPSKWAALADEDASLPDGVRFAYGMDTSWDRDVSWIAIAGKLDDGRIYVELVKDGFGHDWISQWLNDRAHKDLSIAIGWQDRGAPISEKSEKLEATLPAAKAKPMSFADMAASAGTLHDLVEAGELVHIGQEQAQDAVDGAVWRNVSDARVIDRKKSTSDASPLTAIAIAAHLVRNIEPKPRRAPRRIR